MKNSVEIPKYHQLMNPLILALRELGGSASNDELYEKVSEILKIPESILSIPHNVEKDSRSEVQYRLAWARTYLKKYGALINSDRGVWSLTPEFKEVSEIDPSKVIEKIRQIDRSDQNSENIDLNSDNSELMSEDSKEEIWREKLYHVLTQDVDWFKSFN